MTRIDVKVFYITGCKKLFGIKTVLNIGTDDTGICPAYLNLEKPDNAKLASHLGFTSFPAVLILKNGNPYQSFCDKFTESGLGETFAKIFFEVCDEIFNRKKI